MFFGVNFLRPFWNLRITVVDFGITWKTSPSDFMTYYKEVESRMVVILFLVTTVYSPRAWTSESDELIQCLFYSIKIVSNSIVLEQS